MFVDLLLDIDDVFFDRLSRRANAGGTTVEELIRHELSAGLGEACVPLTPDDECLMRPIVRLDMRL